MSDDSFVDNNDEAFSQTLLWGTWELWCDLTPGGSSATGGKADGPQTPGKTREQPNWLSQVKSIGLFDSAEGFWGVFNCILLPSQLPPNSSYYLFRKHIAPMWEHEANRRGGKWVIPFTHSATATDAVAPAAEPSLPVDVAWQTLCLAAIGELFPCAETEICGVTISRGKPRPGSTSGEWKLCLWTRTAEDNTAQMDIAKYVRSILNMDAVPQRDGTVDLQSCPRGHDRANNSTAITFTAHRALMEAKLKYAEGGHSPQPFRPLYSL